MITLKDIAKKANVSVMTVSRVVNGNHSKVSRETAERVQKIIDEEGYVPNFSARSLISKKTNIIAIVMRKDSKPDDPYNAKMLSSIIPTLQTHGYFSMVVCLDKFEEINQYLRAWHATGAIFLGMFEKDIEKIKEVHRIPLIFTDSYHDKFEISNVGIDDYKGGFLAGKKLLECNHEQLAFATYALDDSPVSKARFNGFIHALDEHKVELKESNIFNDYSPKHIAEKISKSNITAIFITADLLALNVIRELKKININVPEDVSVIGFDNLPHGEYASPQLTTIAQDIEQKAKVACDMLINNIDHTLQYTNKIMDVYLVNRESVKTI